MAGEWTPINLGGVCTKIGSGATPRGGSDVYLESGPYSLIRSQNVYNDGFHHDGLAYIGEKHATELDGVEVQKGDVLLNITGDSVARACQVAPDVLPARVNQHVAIIRPDPAKLDPRFLRYFLISPEMQSKLLSWAGSGGTRNALTKGMIESFDVLAPEDIDEQRAIAHILGTLDDKIELNRRMSETLEAMARALFKSWFVDFDPVRAKADGRNPGVAGHSHPCRPARHAAAQAHLRRAAREGRGEVHREGGVMAEINLTQAEADALIAMEKHRASDERVDFPMGGQSVMLPLQSADRREQFLLDLSRGRIDLLKVKMQNRGRQVIVLVRLDLGGAPHRNPDDTEIAAPHLHVYREGYGDKWAVAVPPERFRNVSDVWTTLEDFLRYCNVTEPPHIERGLFT